MLKAVDALTIKLVRHGESLANDAKPSYLVLAVCRHVRCYGELVMWPSFVPVAQ